MHPSRSNALSGRVVIVGAGFAGLEVAKALGRANIQVTLIDRHNHHLFQPLLYQVATAALSAVDIAEPIRKILRPYPSVQVIFGEVSQIDTTAQTVELNCGQRFGYHYLVMACGAGQSYFGHDDWAKWAPGLKSIEDARYIRSQLLLTFERAERSANVDEQKRLLSIAIIGGGPTGVELAGAIAELSRYTLARDFRSISPDATQVTLVEAGPRILSGFSEEVSTYARQRLEQLGVRVLTGQSVDGVGPSSVSIAGQEIPTGFIIWAAGISASPLARQVGETDKAGRIPVDSTLAVPGRQGVFAVGDMAALSGEDGRALPGLAQVAKQEGIHLGRALAAQIHDGTPLPPFRYKSRGNTAIVGRHAAVFETAGHTIKAGLLGSPGQLCISTCWLDFSTGSSYRCNGFGAI